MTLSNELYYLVLTCLLTGLFWLPYILNRLLENGPLKAIWNPLPDTGARRAWANRMQKAHENAVENLVVFAPLVLAVELSKLNSELTAVACMVYFYSRAAHFVAMTLAIPLLRVILFLVSCAAYLTLAFHLLTHV